jgi:hypothetical protein
MLTALAYKKSLSRGFVFKKLTALGSFSTLGQNVAARSGQFVGLPRC